MWSPLGGPNWILRGDRLKFWNLKKLFIGFKYKKCLKLEKTKLSFKEFIYLTKKIASIFVNLEIYFFFFENINYLAVFSIVPHVPNRNWYATLLQPVTKNHLYGGFGLSGGTSKNNSYPLPATDPWPTFMVNFN